MNDPQAWAKAEFAFKGMMNQLKYGLASQEISLPSDELTIVDVGAGGMPYGLALEAWAREQARETRKLHALKA